MSKSSQPQDGHLFCRAGALIEDFRRVGEVCYTNKFDTKENGEKSLRQSVGEGNFWYVGQMSNGQYIPA